MARLATVCAVALIACATSQAQIVNGDFETGNLSGWLVVPTPNGQTLVQDAVQYDIDGPGPKPTSWAARFSVGQITFQSGVFEGISLVQDVHLTGGMEYTFGCDLSVLRPAGGTNAQGGRFELLAGGNVLATFTTGTVNPGVPVYSSLLGNFTPPSTGLYTVGVRITRPFLPPGAGTEIYQYIDNFIPEPASLSLLLLGGLAALRRR